jgi:hypothetical protein
MARRAYLVVAAILAITWMGTVISLATAANGVATQIIVIIRHGEKPTLGLGQLACQGLNRALALPAVIEKQFGKPDAIFAPDPAQAVSDDGQYYYYVRPLATIEPTAIFFGLPLDASIGVFNLDALRHKLESATYWNSLLVVAWEGHEVPKLARLLMSDNGGDPAVVPEWQGSDDFDSEYVVRVERSTVGVSARFERLKEGLNGLPTACPSSQPK